jgi:hypothetical protein
MHVCGQLLAEVQQRVPLLLDNGRRTLELVDHDFLFNQLCSRDLATT